MTPTVILSPAIFGGAEAVVEGETYRHLFRACRLAVGDAVRAVDGRGAARAARVVSVERRRARLALADPVPSGEAPTALTLVVATPRPQRAAWLVEKATEVGVAAVRFVRSERSVRELGGDAAKRLGRVAAAAVAQCGRARVPEVSSGHTFDELAGLLAGAASAWVLEPTAPPGWGGRGPGPWALLVGPEGGWSPAERTALAGLGARPVALAPRTLRVETAAVVGAALLLLPGPPGGATEV